MRDRQTLEEVESQHSEQEIVTMFSASISAPAAIRISATLDWLYVAAKCSGVTPSCVPTSTVSSREKVGARAHNERDEREEAERQMLRVHNDER